VYYIIVRVDENAGKRKNDMMPVRVMGVGVAEWNKPRVWRPGDPVRFIRSQKIFFEGEPVFGDSVIVQGRFLYMIGHGPAENNRVPARISRVPAAEIKNRSAYEFLRQKGGWSKRIDHAGRFFDDVMGEPSLSYNENLKNYLIIYCGMDGIIKTVLFNDFSDLHFKRPQRVYVPPPLPNIQSRPHLFYYSGKEIHHTQTSIYAIYINPAIYQPILLKIPWDHKQQ
jgi:hypothetical protein